ncbi:MAG: prepilin peptidase [Candidatus Methanomethylophilaceae archaeon]|nr:prepilin peptidase [Candidatus Methanomethylophilaceae archaeon]
MYVVSLALSVELAVPVVVMFVAAVYDYRTRTIPDVCWAVMCAICVPMSAVTAGSTLDSIVLLAGGIPLCAYMFSSHPVCNLAIPLSAVYAIPLLSGEAGSDPMAVAAVPVVYWMFVLFYRMELLPGGADAKSLMSLTLAVPGIVTGHIFPMSMSIVLIALATSALYGFRWALENYRKGRVYAGMFNEVRRDPEAARDGFYWYLEDAPDGVPARCGRTDDRGCVDRLVAAGATDVLCSPMIPFLVPLAFATVVVLAAVPASVMGPLWP